MGRCRQTRLFLGVTLVATILMAVPAASALGSTQIRLIDARGGSDPVRLSVSVGVEQSSAEATFAKAADFILVPAGDAELAVTSGSAKPARLRKTLADGASYTVVAIPQGSGGLTAKLVRNGSGAAGQAKLRIVHAAPELGSPDVRLGKRTIAQSVKFGAATGYLTVDPGSFALAIAKPDAGAVIEKKPISLSAGTATTVVVAGSGGFPTRLVEANDSTVTPLGAPHTGLGGLARGGGAPWALALLAALLAGTLGGVVQITRSRRLRP
jgi:hypothetical protein